MLRQIVRKIKETIKTIKPLRHLLYIFALILLYLILIETASKIVDQKRIELDIKKWFERAVNYSTYADIDHTDTALRINWRTDLYVHEFEIASPDPEYILPVFFVDTIRASLPFYELFGGVKANPIIQLRDGIFNFKRNINNHTNLADLTITNKIEIPPFLPFINLQSYNFKLMNCKIKATIPENKAEFPLTGMLKIAGNSIQFKGISEDCKFVSKNKLSKHKTTSSIIFNNLVITIDNLKIESANIEIKDIPAEIIKLFFPGLSSIPNNLKLNGKLQTINNLLVFTGILENQIYTDLPRYLNLSLSTNSNFLANLRFFHIEVSDKDNILLNLKAEKNIIDKWEPLSLYLEKLDLNSFVNGDRNKLISHLITAFPVISINIQKARLFNITVNNALTDIITQNANSNISIEGNVAGGQLNLLAKKIDFSDSKTPETIMATLQVKNPADSLLAFSKNIPKILDCTPTSGKGEIALIYQNTAVENDPHNIKLQINLQDVTIPSLGGGVTIETLSEIPRNLNKLSKLCAESKLTPSEKNSELISNISIINFDELSVNYEINTEKQTILSSFNALSKELGEIKGTFYKTADSNLHLEMKLNNLPEKTLKSAKMSAQSLAAIQELEADNLFQINLFETPEESVIRNDYIEDGYRIWLEKSNN